MVSGTLEASLLIADNVLLTTRVNIEVSLNLGKDRQRNNMSINKRFLFSIYHAIIVLIAILFLSKHVYADVLVVGYYPSWLRSTLPAENIQFEHLTHINHAFAWPDAAGNLKMYSSQIYPELNRLAHENNVKIIISLGGWGNSDGFSPMVADPVKRAFFIDNLVGFLNTNNYDGVDFDWEFPNTINDRNNLTALIIELRDRFNAENPDRLITFAVGTSNWKGQWYDYAQLVHYVDWFNAMCYDFHGSWSAHAGHNAPLYQPPGCNDGAIDVGMIYLHNTRGIPKNQLTVGMPFYGKEFNSSSLYDSFTGEVAVYLYYEIIPKINGGWTYHWDDVSKVPYLTNSTNTKLITFDDTLSIRHKCEWIKEQGYSGGMIWALGQDLYNDEQILLETIRNHLLDSGNTATTAAANEQRQNFHLENNFPNPFNPQTSIEFTLNRATKVTLSVYNAIGQKIKMLVNQKMTAGHHFVSWKGLDDSGRKVAGGVYFYRMESGDFVSMKKMLLIK